MTGRLRSRHYLRRSRRKTPEAGRPRGGWELESTRASKSRNQPDREPYKDVACRLLEFGSGLSESSMGLHFLAEALSTEAGNLVTFEPGGYDTGCHLLVGTLTVT